LLGGIGQESERCLTGIRVVGKTIPEVFVDEGDLELGGYLFVHDNANEHGGAQLGDVRW
jgi:hypothetical protein